MAGREDRTLDVPGVGATRGPRHWSDGWPFLIALAGVLATYAIVPFSAGGAGSVLCVAALAITGVIAGLVSEPATGWAAVFLGGVAGMALVAATMLAIAVLSNAAFTFGGVEVVLAVLGLTTIAMIAVILAAGGLVVGARVAVAYLRGALVTSPGGGRELGSGPLAVHR